MRNLLAAGALLACVLSTYADDVAPPSGVEPLVWTKAFSTLDASDALVFVMITNDDPAKPDKLASKSTHAGRRPWCEHVFHHALRKVQERRADLNDRILLQSMAAGLPSVLTGGKLRNQPARAVLAVCDQDYRLLGLTVGVPDAAALMSLIEDAEEVRLLNKMHSESRNEIVASVAQRSSKRLSRRWRGALEDVLLALGDVNDKNAEDPQSDTNKQIGRLRLAKETFDPTYLADVQLRFGLTEAADRTRLVVLEQHPQARQPWCQAMMPIFAGEDYQTLYKPLCELVWGVQPISDAAVANDFISWWDSNIETETIVLALQSSLSQSDKTLPALPTLDSGRSKTKRKRGATWQEVQTLAVEHAYRRVTVEQLSVLYRSKDLQTIDIQLPRPAKYLFFEPGKSKPLVIREGDQPAKFVGLLKRSKASLTK